MSLTSYRTALPRNLFSLRGGRRYRIRISLQGEILDFFGIRNGAANGRQWIQIFLCGKVGGTLFDIMISQ